MRLRLAHRRSVLCPTPVGWLLLFALAAAPGLLWWFGAEAFLSHTERLPAEVLVLEAWTGAEGAAAAAAEFKRPGSHYQYVVAAGALTGESWTRRRWSYPAIAEIELLRAGISPRQIVTAPSKDTGRFRTFETATAAAAALRAKGIEPHALNVFTLGSHARRSRLIFAKVFGERTRVGMVAWFPEGLNSGPWWHSSGRAQELLKESVGYLFELLLNSGRRRGTTVAPGLIFLPVPRPRVCLFPHTARGVPPPSAS